MALRTQLRIIFIRIVIAIVHAVTEVPGRNAAVVVSVRTFAPAGGAVAVSAAERRLIAAIVTVCLGKREFFSSERSESEVFKKLTVVHIADPQFGNAFAVVALELRFRIALLLVADLGRLVGSVGAIFFTVGKKAQVSTSSSSTFRKSETSSCSRKPTCHRTRSSVCSDRCSCT